MGKLEAAREFFAKDAYATKLTGAVIEEVAPDYAKCSVKLTDNHKNAYGAVMGGVIYTLADFAFAVASNFEKRTTVSLVGQVTFMSASKGSTLFAEARILKDGNRNCFYEVRVTDDTSKLIATVSFTGAHI